MVLFSLINHMRKAFTDMRVFLSILRRIFGIALLGGFVYLFIMAYNVAPKTIDTWGIQTAATPEPVQEEVVVISEEPAEAAEPVEIVEPETAGAPEEEPVEVVEAAPAYVYENCTPTAEALAQYGTVPDVDLNEWYLILANPEHPIEDYCPPELVTIEQQQFDSRIADALNAFVADARAEGLSVYLSSAYRSYADQQYLFNRKIGQGYSAEDAARIVARPGTSEHQTGLVCDITDRYYELKDSSLENTALFIWMSEHCDEYGFIVRYGSDKEDITGYIYEPWHFRYVGVEVASFMKENNLCLEEFWALYEAPEAEA